MCDIIVPPNKLNNRDIGVFYPRDSYTFFNHTIFEFDKNADSINSMD